MTKTEELRHKTELAATEVEAFSTFSRYGTTHPIGAINQAFEELNKRLLFDQALLKYVISLEMRIRELENASFA